MNSQTEVVNSLNCVELASRLATLIAIMLTDAKLNRQPEVLEVVELWDAAECDGFTVDTFCDAYSMLCDGNEITHFADEAWFGVSTFSPIYTECLDMVTDYEIAQSSQQWESVPMEPYASESTATEPRYDWSMIDTSIE